VSALHEIADRYPHGTIRGDELRLVFEFPEPGRPIRVAMRLAVRDLAGLEQVEILAEIAPASRLDPSAALHANLELAVGALALDGATVVLRHVVADDGDALDEAVAALGRTAARFKKRLCAPRATGAPFTAYAD
jgi:hypothetical protein